MFSGGNGCPDGRRIKIIATLGLAPDRGVLEALFAAGADVFRINMSHASHDVMRERVALIRELEEEFDRPIGILVDLQGPKLRLGMFAGGAGIAEAIRFLDGERAPGDASARAPAASGDHESLRRAHRC